MADKSPRPHESKRSGKTLKEKRIEKDAKQATKRASPGPSANTPAVAPCDDELRDPLHENGEPASIKPPTS